MFEQSIAQRMGLLHTESAFQILAQANALEAQGRSIIHCEIGQPDFKTPRHIIEAAYKAMNDGFTGYGPTPGYPQVRETIAEYAANHKHIKTDMEEVVIVPGGKPVMFFTMLMLVNPGDEVIYPNPSFPIYESCIKFAGGVPVPMPLTAENDFRLDLDQFRAAITPKTKLVILNIPAFCCSAFVRPAVFPHGRFPVMRNNASVFEIEYHLVRGRNFDVIDLLRKDGFIKFGQSQDGSAGFLQHWLRNIFILTLCISGFSACAADPDGVIGIGVFTPLTI